MPPAAAVAPARLWSGRSGEPVVETATFAVLVLLAAGKTLGANWSECELTPHLNCFPMRRLKCLTAANGNSIYSAVDNLCF